jgi:hypothetical protein
MTAKIYLKPSFGYPAGRTITITGSGDYINYMLYMIYSGGMS